jgi:hypothetical protein
MAAPAYEPLNNAQTAEPPQARASKKSKKSASARSYEGTMHLPAGSQVAQAAPSAQSNLAQALAPGQTASQPAQSPTGIVRSPAADAWKGLIFSLQANNRTTEAFQEIAQIPPDLRQQLEGDVEFMQALASLYVVSGDTAHAAEYLNRVENFYMLRRTVPPPAIDVQNAWLLMNTGNDHDLYPALMSLDRRRDLTPEQRQQVQTIWANWSVRRANAEMEAGNTMRALDILEAAARDFPNDANVRRAIAGGYVKAGRASDSLALFKTLSMQDAASGDFQAAIGAAMAAKDMAQAETWLRIALDRFPTDPAILAVAARFEQARGNNERASDFWRASLAAMPPGSSAHALDKVGIYPPQGRGAQPSYAPGDLKQLLDPANQPATPVPSQSQLPGYRAAPYNQGAPAQPAQALPSQPQSQQPWTPGPSTRALPLPSPSSSPAPMPAAQTTAPSSAPIYVPLTGNPSSSPSQPTFIEQAATQAAQIKPAARKSKPGKQSGAPSGSSKATGYSGQVQLPASEENIDTTDPASGGQSQNPQQAPAWQRQSGEDARKPNPGAGLRITSAPMDTVAARAQALFADQTDSQLTQGSASAIHAVPGSTAAPATELGAAPAGSTRYKAAQYTPSAQEAATGAYSAPRQQSAQQPAPSQPAQQQAQQPLPSLTPPQTKPSKKARKAAQAAAQQQSEPTLVNAPSVPNPDQTQVTDLPAATQSTSGTGLSDQELEQRNLPPLRGPWVRVQRDQRATSPRDEAEMQLRSIESGYSAWLGGTGLINYRSGDLGYDHLSALEAPFEVSFPAGYHARFTIVAKAAFLDSGQADGNSVIQVTTIGQTKLTQIPNPLGTLLTTDTTPPPQQNAAGIGGELQLAFPHLAIAGGYTPYGFLVSTFTARGMWKPGNGPFTLSVVRDSVKDTQLSYGGLRDPGTASLSFPGNIWGAAVANQFNAQYARGDAESGFYFGAGGQYITGYNIEKNTRFDGTGGAYWRLLTSPEYGNLSIGVNFFAMHYAHNEQAFTYGMGGYFSPDAYFLANVPFTWAAHSGTRWHYNVMGSLGVQAFQEDLAKLFPLVGQESLEVSSGNLALPAVTSVGPNYDLRTNAAYQIGPHWFAGGFLSANNSRNYSTVSTGFFVRYLFRSQPSTATTPTGLFPTDGLRPFTVP